MDIFSGDAINVSGRDLFNAGTELLQKVRRESVKLITHALRQDLLLGIKLKDEGIQDRILGFLRFNLLDSAGNELLHLLAQGIDPSGSGAAFCAHGEASDSVMVKGCAHATAYGICQP